MARSRARGHPRLPTDNVGRQALFLAAAAGLGTLLASGPYAAVAVVPGTAPRARVVVTDVDGTLMDSTHRLPDANRRVLQRCMRGGVPVVLATGKHRGPWVQSLVAEVMGSGLEAASEWTLNAPGVFVQGLLVCDTSGAIVERRLLPAQLVLECHAGAAERGWTLLSYADGDQILSNRDDPQLQRLRALQEPPVEIAPVSGAGVHKLLFLGPPEDEAAVRRAVEALVGNRGSVTVAVPGMVEVLPRGASKADGAATALSMLGLGPGDALAIGDGENDVELLQLVRQAGGVAVAVDNARPALKAVAGEVVGSCDEAGWADAVERWVL